MSATLSVVPGRVPLFFECVIIIIDVLSISVSEFLNLFDGPVRTHPSISPLAFLIRNFPVADSP
jgi:hypothetical protein